MVTTALAAIKRGQSNGISTLIEWARCDAALRKILAVRHGAETLADVEAVRRADAMHGALADAPEEVHTASPESPWDRVFSVHPKNAEALELLRGASLARGVAYSENPLYRKWPPAYRSRS